MNLVRKSLLVILTPVFLLLLSATALDFGVLRIAGHPSTVKKLIASSGVYNNVVSTALDQVSKNNGKDSGDVNLSDAAVKAAAAKALNPALLQSSTNQVIDGLYLWLDGKVTQPNFNVDLSGAKANFTTYVGQAAEARAANLPRCTSISASFEPLGATCLPVGITPAQAGDKAKTSVSDAKGFLDNPVLSASTIKDSNGHSVFASTNAQKAPKQYRRAKESPYILAILTLLIGTVMVFASSTWPRGLKHVGIILIIAGLGMLVFGWGLNQFINGTAIPKLKINNALLQSDAQSLLKNLARVIEHNYFLFGAIYAVAGAVAIGGPMIHQRRTKKPTERAEQETAVDKAEPQSARKPKTAKKVDF